MSDLKLNGFSSNNQERLLEDLKKNFPEVFSEGKVDVEKLQRTLGEALSSNAERYGLSWAGKSSCFSEIQKETSATLVPQPDESVNFETSKNVFIEGDNLEVLRVLQRSYYGKVKMIYIDPPYNTGNDFVYNDNFKKDKTSYEEESGQRSEEGNLTMDNRLRKNTHDNGHFHSDWLNMMYPRLFLARNLLRRDGAIYVSIDDNECANLRLIMDEVFGEENFVAQFPWRKRTAKSDVPFGVSQDYEWIIVFAKSNDFVACIEGNERKYYESPDLPNMKWRIHDMTTQRTASERPNSDFTLINPKNGEEFVVNPNAVWRITKDSFEQFYKQKKVIFPGDYDFLNISKPVLRYFKEEDEAKDGKMFGFSPVSTNFPKEVGMTQDGTKDIDSLFEGRVFGFPKPVSLIKYLVKSATSLDKTAIILDFFAGSGTSAHSVLELNSEDNGKRTFISVQIDESISSESDVYKRGYKNIADIARERIRRAGKRIIEEAVATRNDEAKIDTGFKAFKLNSSNFIQWHGIVKTDKELAEQLSLSVDNVKPESELLSILYELMLKTGMEITEMIVKRESNGVTSFVIGENKLVICLDGIVNQDFIESLETSKPTKVIFLERVFGSNDDLKTNTILNLERAGIDFKVV